MSRRIDLHNELINILGTKNVYFQPPETIKLKYPCIIYNLDNYATRFADDETYLGKRNYQILYITKNPDDEMIEKLISSFQLIRFSRSFTSDNLNHYSYTLYY